MKFKPKKIKVWPVLQKDIESFEKYGGCAIWQCPVCLRTHICIGDYNYYCFGSVFLFGRTLKMAVEIKNTNWYWYETTHRPRKMIMEYI